MDSTGGKLGDFEDYLQHMSSNGRWAGSLEAYAAAKTYKIAVYVIPAPADMAAVVYNSSAKALALWFTDRPGHFDLPDTVTGMAESKQPGDFPRGGGRDGQDDGGSEPTFFTQIAEDKGKRGVADEAASCGQATVFTAVAAPKKAGQGKEVQRHEKSSCNGFGGFEPNLLHSSGGGKGGGTAAGSRRAASKR